MSLKDRLQTQSKTPAIIKKEEEKEPKYYPTSEVSQGVDSLGEIDTLFADDEINYIIVMGAKNIFIERKGRKSKISLSYRDNVRLENIIRKNAQFHGLKFDENHPYIEFSHKLGINVCATLPPLSSNASMIVKCYKDKFANLKGLCEAQVMSKEIALFIEALASLKLNVIIAGDKNTLKTSLLSAIVKKTPQNYNAVLIDYANELKTQDTNVITYDFKNYENKNLIDNIMSTNPDKVFLNDCKDYSCFEKYVEAGYRGICATYYAQNPLDVLQGLYLNKSDVVIFVERKNSKRLISSVSLVNGSELENIFYLNNDEEHCSSGIVPDFYSEIEQGGLSITSTIFEADYKHTYYKTINDNALSSALKKNINPDILKKFKKELEIKENSQENLQETEKPQENE